MSAGDQLHLRPGERAVRLDVQGGPRVRGLEGADRARSAPLHAKPSRHVESPHPGG